MKYRRVKPPEWRGVIEGLAPKMARLGFQRRRESWYRYSNQVTQLIDVRLGFRSNGLRLGLSLRRLDRSTHPSFNDCHIRAGLQWLLPREEELLFNAARDLRTPEFDVEKMVSVFWGCIHRHALPILESTRTLSGIRELLESQFSQRFQVAKAIAESGVLLEDRPDPSDAS